jgi:hypothetical protein
MRTHVEDAIDLRTLEHAHQVIPKGAVGPFGTSGRSEGTRGDGIPHHVESGAAEKLTHGPPKTVRHDARLLQRVLRPPHSVVPGEQSDLLLLP